MTYSLGLTLYALGRRRVQGGHADWAARPRGRLVWLHASQPDEVAAALALARRLVDEDGLPVLLTAPVPPADVPAGVVTAAPPPEQPPDAQAFLAHWNPEVIVFFGGELRPVLLHQIAANRLPLLMVDARAPHLPAGRRGWFPGLLRKSLAGFRHIITLDDSAARSFRKAGVPPDRIEAAGRMELPSAALPYAEADRAALARALATRPIWLAAAVPPAEEAAIITAHREALRLSHRLLLILVPESPERAAALAEHIEATEGWSVMLRSADAEPDAETEVYIPDTEADFGLWYRLAPVTFLGGSLAGAGCLRDPLEPAALGSAILHGPRPGVHARVIGRLGAARAAGLVNSGQDLARALGDLLSPDRAARQAQAAWAVASDGADVTVRVVGLIRNILEGDA